MKALIKWAVLGLIVAKGMAQDATVDHDLIARAAANQSAADLRVAAPTTAMADEESHARAAVALADARLEMVLARKAHKADKHEEAARRAIRALNSLRGLPAKVDASDLELQAEGILAKASRKGVNVESLRGKLGAGGDPQGAATQQAAPIDTDPLDLKSKAAHEIVRGYSGADTPDIATQAAPDDLKQRTLRNQPPSDLGYRPGREAFDRTAITERNEQRLHYQGSLEEAAKSDELRRLVEADEARVAPQSDVSYPDDWKERVARRSRFAGGEVARSATAKDASGRESYAAIYEINDLSYVPPDFQPSISLDPVEDLRNTLDRDALRNRSMIFGGWPEDLAAGIPLLRFFGGVDDFAYRGPKYSREKAAEIAEQVKAFTAQMNESKIILVP